LIHPLLVEPEKPRLCYDARWLNLWTPSPSFVYQTMRDFQRGLKEGDWMFSLDHKSGYQHVRLTPNSWKYFGFEWQKKKYAYTVLPFGWAPACFVYNTLSAIVCGYLKQTLRVGGIAYIDDFGFSMEAGRSRQDMVATRWVVMAVMYLAGYFVSLKKSRLSFTRRLVLLGIGVDTELQRFFIPEDKLLKFLAGVEAFLSEVGPSGDRPVRVKDIQRLVGRAESLSLAVPPISIYLRNLWDLLARVDVGRLLSTYVPDFAIADVRELRGAALWEPLSSWMPERHMKMRLETDASLVGLGAVWYTGAGVPVTVAETFKGREADLDIAAKEALAVIRALELAPAVVQDCFLDVYIDNENVRATALRGASCIPEVRRLAREMLQFELCRHVVIRVYRVSTVDNITGDRLSRSFEEKPNDYVDRRDYILNWDYFRRLEEQFGRAFTLDICASQWDKRVGRFISRGVPNPSEPGAEGCVCVNVFMHQDFLGPAGEEWLYCYPPTPIISPLWRHLRLCGARGVMIFQRMPEAQWFGAIGQQAVRVGMLAEAGTPGVLISPASGAVMGPLPWDLMFAVFEFGKP
jgi:hypothetical protein